MTKAKKCENLIIVGGGLIGLSFAAMLASLKIKATLVDQDKILSKKSIFKDSRTIAIAAGTRKLFEKHDLWKKISPFVEPINNIKVFNRSEDSKILFNKDKQYGPMGHIIQHSSLKQALIKSIQSSKYINFIENFKITETIADDDYIQIVNDKNIDMSARLIIAADGKASILKSLNKIRSYKIKYSQSALALNFKHSKNHKNTAYEIFLQKGPLATLPVKNKIKKEFESSLIWSQPTTTTNRLLKIKNNSLKEIIEEKIYPYLGKVTFIREPKAFPLSAHICEKFYSYRTAFVGDAAHSLHPIAGQGWNLGMRDLKYLTKVLMESKKLGLDLGSQYTLKKYNDERYIDVSSLLFITHGLNKIFSLNSIFLNNIRAVGFNYINNNKKLNKKFVEYAMGINL